jgi:hypothetical protein
MLYRNWDFIVNPIVDEHKKISSSYEDMWENLKLGDKYRERKAELLEHIEESNILMEPMQEKIVMMLYENLLDNNIQMISIDFAEEVSEAKDEEKDDVTEDIDLLSSPGVISMSVILEAKGEYYNMLDFVDDLKDDEIAITSIKMMFWEDDIVYCVLDLKFYAVKLH